MSRRFTQCCLLCGLLLIVLQGCYLFKQGGYIIRYGMAARPVERLLADTLTPDVTRSFLELTDRIRRFAVDSIGLKENRNYTTFVAIEKEYLVDVVSAAAADTFRQHRWCYPLFGCVPYKGFFETPDARREADRLRDRGLDVHVGRVDAFSTLGIFTDPLYSFMQRFSPFRLASLLIHEQTHATLFIRNRIEFNERLASFIGNEGALHFIRATYGDTSTVYRRARAEAADEATFIGLMQQLYGHLQRLYDSIPDPADRRAAKSICIEWFKDSVMHHYEEIFQTPDYRRFDRMTINNASLAIWMTYGLDLDVFYDLYRIENGSLRATMHRLQTLSRKRGDPLAALQEMVAGATHPPQE